MLSLSLPLPPSPSPSPSPPPSPSLPPPPLPPPAAEHGRLRRARAGRGSVSNACVTRSIATRVCVRVSSDPPDKANGEMRRWRRTSGGTIPSDESRGVRGALVRGSRRAGPDRCSTALREPTVRRRGRRPVVSTALSSTMRATIDERAVSKRWGRKRSTASGLEAISYPIGTAIDHDYPSPPQRRARAAPPYLVRDARGPFARDKRGAHAHAAAALPLGAREAGDVARLPVVRRVRAARQRLDAPSRLVTRGDDEAIS